MLYTLLVSVLTSLPSNRWQAPLIFNKATITWTNRQQTQFR